MAVSIIQPAPAKDSYHLWVAFRRRPGGRRSREHLFWKRRRLSCQHHHRDHGCRLDHAERIEPFPERGLGYAGCSDRHHPGHNYKHRDESRNGDNPGHTAVETPGLTCLRGCGPNGFNMRCGGFYSLVASLEQGLSNLMPASVSGSEETLMELLPSTDGELPVQASNSQGRFHAEILELHGQDFHSVYGKKDIKWCRTTPLGTGSWRCFCEFESTF